VLRRSRLKRFVYDKFESASQCCNDVVDKLPLKLNSAPQCCSDVVLKLSERDNNAVQCSREAVLRRSSDRRAEYESSESASQCWTDVVEREPESEISASQCCTEVVEREPERLSRAVQCSIDAVLSASRERNVVLERSEIVWAPVLNNRFEIRLIESQCATDVVLKLLDRLNKVAKWYSDTVDKAPLRLCNAVQCCCDAVSSAFRLRWVSYDKLDMASQCTTDV
jgi:hypothetical protein